MIDIGQGDAFLINDKNDYYLIDVGGPKYKTYDSGQRIMVPYLKSIGVKKIKAIFISHEDKDHVGNLDTILDNFKVEKIIADDKISDDFRKYKPILMKKHDKVPLKDGYIECVFEGAEAEERNDRSLGLMVNIGGVKILTMGDLSSEYEDTLNLQADILKLSHHGSRFSSSKEFIDKVNPKVCLISAGRNNTYGHPSNEVLENIKGKLIYNTQEDGLVTIEFGKKIKIKPYLKGGFFR